MKNQQTTTNWYACVICRTPVHVEHVHQEFETNRIRGYCPTCDRIVTVGVNWSGKMKSKDD